MSVSDRKPLKRIPKPPQSYIDFKMLMQGLDFEESQAAVKGFYKNKEYKKKEICDFLNLLHGEKHKHGIIDYNFENCFAWNGSFLGDGYSPIEKIELWEEDRKKHGNVGLFLLFDLDYFKDDGGAVKLRKVWMRIDHYDPGIQPWVKDPDSKKDYRHHPGCLFALSGWDKNLSFNCCRRIGRSKNE